MKLLNTGADPLFMRVETTAEKACSWGISICYEGTAHERALTGRDVGDSEYIFISFRGGVAVPCLCKCDYGDDWYVVRVVPEVGNYFLLFGDGKQTD
jgi:hypothetical protein